MRLRPWRAAAAGLTIAALFSGCRSAGYADSLRPAVAHMAHVIQTYNAARPSDVSSAGAACRSAGESLLTDTAPVDQSAPTEYARLGHALREAYRAASAGFTDCADGATRGDYIKMVRADSEIAAANRWIQIARGLDR